MTKFFLVSQLKAFLSLQVFSVQYDFKGNYFFPNLFSGSNQSADLHVAIL